MINRWQRYGLIHRSIMLGSVFSITALVLWSCKPTPPPAPELPEVTLKPIEAPPALTPVHCAIAADSPSLALMHVASDLGYFENEGLEIKITKVPPSTAPKQLPLLNLLLQDDIDCIAQTLDGYLRTQDGQLFQSTVIASLYTSTGADGLVVTNPITSIDDLLDQSIGGDRHHPGMLLTYQALRQLGYSVDDFMIKSIVAGNEPAVRPSYADIFRQEGVVAIAASKPMLGHIVEDTGGRILLTSVEFEDLLLGTLIVEKSDLEQDSDRYRRLLRGVYQAIALYNSDRPHFLQVAASSYGQSPQEFEQTLQGISYTSYPDLQRIIGTGSSTGTVFQTFTDLNMIHQDLGLQNGPLFYDDHIDNRLIPNLFDLDR